MKAFLALAITAFVATSVSVSNYPSSYSIPFASSDR